MRGAGGAAVVVAPVAARCAGSGRSSISGNSGTGEWGAGAATASEDGRRGARGAGTATAGEDDHGGVQPPSARTVVEGEAFGFWI